MLNKLAMQPSPLVSVLMAAYNVERYISYAIQSILDQSFQDFELIIFNDGSTDGTASVVTQYSDPRIRFIDNPVNKGLAHARRNMLAAAIGKYVAILDSDDIAMSGRLAQQYDFMERRSDVVLCGGNAILIDEEGKSTDNKLLHPAYQATEIKNWFFWNNILVNSSVMFRREQAVMIGGYRDMAPVEDYDLFVRLTDQHSMHVFNEPLVYYRVHGQNISQAKRDTAIAHLRTIKDQQLQLLGVNHKIFGVVFDALLWRRFADHTPEAFFSLLTQLKSANHLSGKLPVRPFDKELFNRWYDVVTSTMPKNQVAPYLFRKELFKISFTTFKQKRRIVKFWLRSLF